MKSPKTHRQEIEASYDSARHTVDTASEWRGADSKSANAELTPDVRKTIRERARYEVANNSILAGIVDTYVTDLIGSWVSISLPAKMRQSVSELISSSFDGWCCETRFWQKLRTLIRSKVIDGEAFAQFSTDNTLKNGVTLNLTPIECDRVESWFSVVREDEVDGIRIDKNNHPVAYRVLNYHPGDYRVSIVNRKGEWISARYILHYFDATRPEQVRGISDLAPCLNLPNKLRSYTNSVINSASRAAEVAGVLETDLVPECWDAGDNAIGKCSAQIKASTTFQAQRNALVTLPEGWHLQQLNASQPTSTYAMFKREIINEIGRCLSMPYNIAACDSSSYNYASGRLDHLTYERSIATKRSVIGMDILDRVFYAWLEEFAEKNELSPKDIELAKQNEWFFTSRFDADPNKEASADTERLNNGTETLSGYYSRVGKDWKRETSQRIQELVDTEKAWNEAREKAGLEPAPVPSALGFPSSPASKEKNPEEIPDNAGQSGKTSENKETKK